MRQLKLSVAARLSSTSRGHSYSGAPPFAVPVTELLECDRACTLCNYSARARAAVTGTTRVHVQKSYGYIAAFNSVVEKISIWSEPRSEGPELTLQRVCDFDW